MRLPKQLGVSSNSARLVIERLGTARWIYSAVLAFALYAFHRNSAREIGVIVGAWVATSLVSPLDEGIDLVHRVSHLWARDALTSTDGAVIAYQAPGILLVRQAHAGSCDLGDILGVNDSVRGASFALTLDRVGRDGGVLGVP